MRYVTETRLKLLEETLRSIPDPDERSYALHLLNSLRSDIESNYAEIQRPIRLSDFDRPSGDDKRSGLIRL